MISKWLKKRFTILTIRYLSVRMNFFNRGHSCSFVVIRHSWSFDIRGNFKESPRMTTIEKVHSYTPVTNGQNRLKIIKIIKTNALFENYPYYKKLYKKKSKNT